MRNYSFLEEDTKHIATGAAALGTIGLAKSSVTALVYMRRAINKLNSKILSCDSRIEAIKILENPNYLMDYLSGSLNKAMLSYRHLLKKKILDCDELTWKEETKKYMRSRKIKTMVGHIIRKTVGNAIVGGALGSII